LCECGCGQETKISANTCNKYGWAKGEPRRFLHGHSSRVNNPMAGTHPSEETRKKLSAAKMGIPFTEEHRAKIRSALAGRQTSPGTAFKKGNTINVGHRHTEETKKKMGRAAIGRVNGPETRKKIGDAHKGVALSEEHRKKLSIAGKGRALSAEHKNRIADAHRNLFLDQAHCEKMGKAWQAKPNKPEMLVMRLLDEMYPGEWKYTGDFSFMINGKNPDFVNCNGQKKCIELFGSYWHEGENPQDRVDVFSPFGFETLVIWEHDLKNIGDVANRIMEFHEAA